jgi:hypothetical protein
MLPEILRSYNRSSVRGTCRRECSIYRNVNELRNPTCGSYTWNQNFPGLLDEQAFLSERDGVLFEARRARRNGFDQARRIYSGGDGCAREREKPAIEERIRIRYQVSRRAGLHVRRVALLGGDNTSVVYCASA